MAAKKRSAAARKRVRSMEEATALAPWIVADSVFNEIGHCYPGRVPQEQQDRITEYVEKKAEAVWNGNPEWRKQLTRAANRPGFAGPEQLAVWVRHWVGAELKREGNPVARDLARTDFWRGIELRCPPRR